MQSVETRDSGDGTVSIQGAYLADVQCQFTGEAHVTLIKSQEARRTLQEIMGATGLLLALPDVEINVRDVNVAVGQPVHLSIVGRGQLNRFAGELVFEGAALPADPAALVLETMPFVALRGRAPLPFRYDGPDIASATVRLDGIGTPGLYRIVIRPVGGGEPLARSMAFVVSAMK